jgi:hypothetical protein
MSSVQSTGKAGYKEKLKGHIVKEFHSPRGDAADDRETKCVVRVQNAWRARVARVYVSALKQESLCRNHREMHPVISGEDGITVSRLVGCAACSEGDAAAGVRQKISRSQYQEVQKMLFWGQPRMTSDDTGTNWNQRFQRTLDLPEETVDEKLLKYNLLSGINNDFVSAATRYAKTIISEYFLHAKDKSIRPSNFGGLAGGQVRVYF